MNKTKLIFTLCLLIFLVGSVCAEQMMCCEKTKGGVWCASAEGDECDTSNGLQKAPTSCGSTSYCRLGCCFNSRDGGCSMNTPKKVCDTSGGTWNSDATCNIDQCKKGCCVVGNNAFLDTFLGCRAQSSSLGVEMSFKEDIQDEFECASFVSSEDKGACVFENSDYETDCKFIAQKECVELRKSQTGETTAEVSQSFLQRLFGNDEQTTTTTAELTTQFYKGRLCTDENLNTKCAPTTKTICKDGKVYFTDTCGNLANVYDSTKYNEKNYWAVSYLPQESCDSDVSNADSATCGNCDYQLGSVCGLKRTQDTNPAIGDYLCRNLDCTYNNHLYKHTESWCANEGYGNKGVTQNLPGSEHFVMSCYDGEISVEQCGGSELREKICIQGELNEVSVAACTVNRWSDCYEINNSKDCNNTDQRDCVWKELSGISSGIDCTPKYAPAFEFWKEDTNAIGICSQASVQCLVTYERGLFEKGWDAKKNKECLTDAWKNSVAATCSSLGDCGVKKNYLGYNGYNVLNDLYKISKSKQT